MNRRDYLLRMSALAGSALLPGFALAAEEESWSQQFAAGLKKNPYLAGYSSMAQDMLATPQLTLEGKIPPALRGTFYRNGPARHELGGQRYHHWFDGDGMVQAFRFTDNGVSHLGRFVHTEKYVAETKAGKFLWPGFGTSFPNALPVTGPDAINAANTSILPLAGELLALWEGGSAYKLDPDTIETIGPKTWRADLKGAPFSAHPKIDQDGTVWNFGVSRGMVVLYQISSKGALLKADAFSVPDIAMVHDFAITAKHLVLLLPSLRFNSERLAQGASFLECNEWLPNAPMRVLIVDKSDWSKRKLLELPPGFVFHMGNAWEDSDGQIRFDYVHADDAALMLQDQSNVMRGVVSGTPRSRTALVTIDMVKGVAKQTLLNGAVEFPRIDSRFTGLRNRDLYTLLRTDAPAQSRGFNAVMRRNLDTGKTDSFDYGEQFVVEEHLFVPRPGSSGEGDGWLIGSALNVVKNISVVSVFEAGKLADGPIARASLPYALPLGFHGAFVSA